ncbi:glucose dehydrogenase [FAD, quinone]-like [Planococcus citri]|uniref:glucose dehydrogenase [FAD, quinone]-like n=1 Tax=Planococcus citri TaxID=170843 RepID=UPI0031F8DD7C
MKFLGCVLFICYIHLCHRGHALDNPPDSCSGCTFDDTPTILDARQCSSTNKLSKEDKDYLKTVDNEMRNNCKIADPCRRVRSMKASDEKVFEDNKYDFIIVGAGVAGPVLANRLSSVDKYKVLLLEAGPEEPVGASVPYFSNSAVNTSVDWKYQTQPEANACLKTKGVCDWPRGKMVCGTFCMSGMMYTRGSPEIYNSWSKQGNVGWNFTEVLKYFKLSERNTQSKDKIDPEYHGFDGPMPVGNFPHIPKIATIMLEAAKQAGFGITDLSGKNQTGFAAASVMVDNGVRASPNRMYLRPILKRQNLRVFIESYATKIIFDKDRAVAVEFVDKFNKTHKALANREIILSGGTIGSAQLLMLSGIGPKEHLEKLKIPVIKDLPVGKNVHHHVGVEGTARFKNIQENYFNPDSLKLYLTNQTGPFSSTGLTQVSGFWSSSKAKPNIPDIQFFLDPYCSPDECHKFYKKWENQTVAGMRSIYLITDCRGKIELSSNNPFDYPKIYANYLCDKKDEEATVEGILKLQQILNTTAFKDYYLGFGAPDESLCTNFTKNPSEYWRCQTRMNTLGENHHAGSCKMGPLNDNSTVVDPQLRVKGIQGLRVADASIMPTPINCNTIAPVLMIAEKAADMILNPGPAPK